MAGSSARKRRWHLVALCGLGLALSLLLEFIHVRTYLAPSKDSFCSVGSSFDCATVAAAPSSVFLGIPWAIWGSLGFAVLLVAALRRSLWLLPLSLGAALISVVLLAVELTQIGSVCLLCEAVHVTSWLLAALAFLRRKELDRGFRDGATLYALLVLPLTLLATLWIFLPPYWAAFSYKSDPPFSTGATEEGHPWIGSTNPTLTLHEFTDYRCPHCAVASSRSLRLLADHPGLRVVRHQQPGTRCSAAKRSCLAVPLAYCAEEQGRFWRADRWLFVHARGGKSPRVEQMAEDLALDLATLRACSARADILARADAEWEFAKKNRIIDTPGYLADGQRVRLDEIQKLVRERAP